MTAYWFRPKRYGYGATPVTWQGWAITGLAVAVIVTAVVLARIYGPAYHWTWIPLIAVEAVVVTTFWIISRRKTDGEWRWRWGR
jgi:hypothetical protein